MKNLIAAITLTLLVAAPATAQTREEFCTAAADLTLALGELRDEGVGPSAIYEHLVAESGWDPEYARRVIHSVWIRGNGHSPRDLGYAVWTSCMGEAS